MMLEKFYLRLFHVNRKPEFLFSLIKHRNYSVEKGDFCEKFVQIRSCGDLYKKWRNQKLFPTVPEHDLIFKVPFMNISPDSSQNSISPTVLALHGAPGSWRDFTSLATYLYNCGNRVIAPSFPDFHIYKPGIFRHSDEEKAQYLKDFLAAISVSHIDLLICHSSAVYPGLILCLNEKPKIKSLCLLNPGTFNAKDMRATRPFTLLQNFVKASENSVLLKIIEIIGPFVLRNILKTPIRFESMLEPLLSATSMVHGNITESRGKFLQLVSQKLPMLYVFSENDPLISAKPSYELAELLGASVSDIFIYDNEGNLVQKGSASSTLKVIAFQQGSHYAFLKYPELLNKEIADFLKCQSL